MLQIVSLMFSLFVSPSEYWCVNVNRIKTTPAALMFMDELLAQYLSAFRNYSFNINFLQMCDFFFPCTPDEPGGGDKPSDDKRKEQTTPVVSPSQGSPEAKEERYELIIPFR